MNNDFHMSIYQLIKVNGIEERLIDFTFEHKMTKAQADKVLYDYNTRLNNLCSSIIDYKENYTQLSARAYRGATNGFTK